MNSVKSNIFIGIMFCSLLVIGLIIGNMFPIKFNSESNKENTESITKPCTTDSINPLCKTGDNETIIQYDGTVIDKKNATFVLIDMLHSHKNHGTINKTSINISYGYSDENGLPTDQDLWLSDGSHLIPAGFGGYRDDDNMKIPKYLKTVLNETTTKMKKEFKDHPFIISSSYENIPRISNTTISTVSGNIVIDSSGNKIIVLGDGSTIQTDSAFKIGDYITLNKVAHDRLCELVQITLSNQTEPITSNVKEIFGNPEKHGLMSMKDAEAKWHSWVNQDWIAEVGCDKKEFITWELVGKN